MTKRGFNKLTSSLEVHVHAIYGARLYNVTYRIKHPQVVELSQYVNRDNALALSEFVEGFVHNVTSGNAELSYGCSYSRESGIGFDVRWQRDAHTSTKEIIHRAKMLGRVLQSALERKLRQMQAAYPEIDYRATFEPGA